MASQILPVHSNSEHYKFRTVLAGEIFAFRFDYNTRGDCWFFSVSDKNGAPILQGRRIALGTVYFDGLSDPRRPKGWIVALDTTNENVEAGRFDLGNRVILVFMDDNT